MATHEASQFVNAGKRKQERTSPSDDAKRAKVRERPTWVFKRGELGQSSSINVFIGEKIAQRPLGQSSKDAFCAAHVSWRTTLPAAKRRAQQRAKTKNELRRAFKMSFLQSAASETLATPQASLWGIGRGSQWPLHKDDVQEMYAKPGRLKELARNWEVLTKHIAPDKEHFPSEVRYKRLLHTNLLALSADMQQRVNTITADLQVLLGQRGCRLDAYESKLDMTCLYVSDTTSKKGAIIMPSSIRFVHTF